MHLRSCVVPELDAGKAVGTSVEDTEDGSDGLLQPRVRPVRDVKVLRHELIQQLVVPTTHHDNTSIQTHEEISMRVSIFCLVVGALGRVRRGGRVAGTYSLSSPWSRGFHGPVRENPTGMAGAATGALLGEPVSVGLPADCRFLFFLGGAAAAALLLEVTSSGNWSKISAAISSSLLPPMVVPLLSSSSEDEK